LLTYYVINDLFLSMALYKLGFATGCVVVDVVTMVLKVAF